MTPQERIERLEVEIRRLQVEYEKFFNGGRSLPPEDLRDKLRNEIRLLRNMTLRSVADSWRLGQVEARLATYSELFGRRLRQREEGRGQLLPSLEPQEAPDARVGIVCTDRVTPQAAAALFAGLAGSGGPALGLDTFTTYLERQVEAIRARTGCSGVRFRLEPEGNRMKLKAKPI
jgi:hypothetical protein